MATSDYTRMRFEAAKAAMQGLLANHLHDGHAEDYAKMATKCADALLAELGIKPEAEATPPQPDDCGLRVVKMPKGGWDIQSPGGTMWYNGVTVKFYMYTANKADVRGSYENEENARARLPAAALAWKARQ